MGCLARDELYFKSSDPGSDNSLEALDPKAEDNVDLPSRRRIERDRYDATAMVPFFELGMVFENVQSFRQAISDYAIDKGVQVKLRPNEPPQSEG